MGFSLVVNSRYFATSKPYKRSQLEVGFRDRSISKNLGAHSCRDGFMHLCGSHDLSATLGGMIKDLSRILQPLLGYLFFGWFFTDSTIDKSPWRTTICDNMFVTFSRHETSKSEHDTLAGITVLNKLLRSPYLLGGVGIGGVPLGSHFLVCILVVMFYFVHR